LTDISKILDRYNPNKVSKEIAVKAKQMRLAMNITQQQLASKSGVSLGSIKRFESTGKISLQNLLLVAVVLDSVEDFAQLFTQKKYNTIDEVIKQNKTKTRSRARNPKD
jgi:transcriptional regulator with XRE-family HTH domain